MNTKHIILLASVLLIHGCTLERQESRIESCPIQISAGFGGEATRALLNSGDITTGTQITLYDQYFDGSSLEGTLINGKTATYGTPDWTIADEPTDGYPWIFDENHYDHYFFGWLTKDKDNLTPAGIFGSSPTFSTATNTLTLPSTTITLGSTQFDFCYSDLVIREAAEANYSRVDIPLRHLFTSFGFKAHNYTSDAIVIKSVKVYGLWNQKSATVKFDTENKCVTPTYTQVGQSWKVAGSGLELVASNIAVASEATVNNIMTNGTGKGTSATDAFFLMWPQTSTEMEPGTIDNETNPVTYDPTKAVIVVTYTQGGSSDIIKAVGLRPVSSTNGWDAGTRHIIELAFREKSVNIMANAIPWDYYNPSIDYSAGVSATEAGHLTYRPATCVIDDETNTIYFRGSSPIIGDFKLSSPMDATWMIGKNGDFDAFEIDNINESSFGDGVDYNYGTITDESASFSIYPKITDPDRDYMITLTFSVRTTSGDVYNADEFVQVYYPSGVKTSKVYKIVLQATR